MGLGSSLRSDEKLNVQPGPWTPTGAEKRPSAGQGRAPLPPKKMENKKKMADDPEVIKRGLRKIRRSKRAIVGLFIGFIPVGILSAIVSEATKIHFMIFIGAYFALLMICDFYLGLTSTCPRCNELYYWRMTGIGYRNFFTKRCLNCGLELDDIKPSH